MIIDDEIRQYQKECEDSSRKLLDKMNEFKLLENEKDELTDLLLDLLKKHLKLQKRALIISWLNTNCKN